MGMLVGLVDCASVYCPDVVLKTVESLVTATPGDIVEVICGTREEAIALMKDCENLGHKVISIDQDRAGNYRLEIEKAV